LLLWVKEAEWGKSKVGESPLSVKLLAHPYLEREY